MQRRTDGLTDFKRPWADYVDGFGHLAGCTRQYSDSGMFSVVRVLPAPGRSWGVSNS